LAEESGSESSPLIEPKSSARGTDPRTLLSEDAADLLATRPGASSRGVVYGVALLVATVGSWAALAPVERHVSAKGAIAFDGEVSVVRAAAAGVLRSVHIHEGDAVAPGSSLFELVADEPTPAEQASHAVAALEAELAREEESAALAAQRTATLEERLAALALVEARAREQAEHAATAARLEIARREVVLKSDADRLSSLDRELELQAARHARLVESTRGSSDARDRVEESELALSAARRERRSLEGEVEASRIEVERLRAESAERAAAFEREAAGAHEAAASVRADVQRSVAERSLAHRALESRRDAARDALAAARRIAGPGVADDGAAASPEAGRVARVTRAPGERVQRFEPVVVIIPRSARLEARVRVAGSSAALVREGARARIRAGGSLVSGTVRRVVGPVADSELGVGAWVAVAPDDTALLAAPNLPVHVEIVTGATTPLGWLFGSR
jgi:multidrug resistance efflux pump